ncbi:hypothetical protein [Martelella mediterranea]|uniref:hypothetical protein n=1 Tax=uncultured Martelella sp. TaxID=392331 RepID=UPI000D06F486|nr:hypothetical protein [uncultured Martelella sp.]
MKSRITFPLRALWGRHRGLCIAFLATAFITLVFALQFIFSVFYWHNPENRNLELKGWMTLGHVAVVHDIPASELAEELDLAPDSRSRRMMLRQIARMKGISLDELEDEIAEALDEYEEEKADADE